MDSAESAGGGGATAPSNMDSFDGDLDLSRFRPDPETKEVVYKYAIDEKRYVVYARKRDCILPFDRFYVEFSDGSMNVCYPKDSSHASSMVSLFASSMKSFTLTCRIMGYMLSNVAFVDWFLFNNLFEKARELIGSMSLDRAAFHRYHFSANASYWPAAYYSAILESFDRAFSRF